MKAFATNAKFVILKHSTRGYLKVHSLAKHEGVKYDCQKCDDKGSSKLILIYHVRSEHDGVRFSCDECAYQAKRL